MDVIRFVSGQDIGRDFANQGLSCLCSNVGIRDLKTLRLVCRGWNDIVARHPKYRGASVRMGNNWKRQADALQLGRLTQWTRVSLDYFHYSKNRAFFPRVWLVAGTNVTRLSLHRTKISCTELNGLLNASPSVQDLSLDDVDFTPELAGTVMLQNPDRAPTEQREAVFCTHSTGFTFPASNAGRPVLHPTIRILTFLSTRSFPLCSLDYLAERCRGTLEKLVIENSQASLDGLVITPDLQLAASRFARLLLENSATVRSFTFYQNATGLPILTAIQESPAYADFDPLELVLGAYADPRRLRQGQGGVFQPVEPFLRMIRDLHGRRVEAICFRGRHDDVVAQALPTLFHGHTALKRLKLDFVSSPNRAVLLNFLGTLRNLEEVVIQDVKGGDTRWDDAWRGEAEIINNISYMSNLPTSIRAVTIAHKLVRNNGPTQLSESLVTRNLSLLSKLYIRDARHLTDTHVQQIIEHLSQLTELTLRKGRRLTDGGFTGLSPEACKSLNTCGQHALMAGCDEGVILDRPGRSLTELMYIQKLDFTACSGISDVCVRYGIKFDQLKYMDLSECCHVSDMGIFWLGYNNPTLEHLELRKNSRISHFGLNQLVTNTKIKNIQTSALLLERQMGNANYVIHPLFHEVATVAPDRIVSQRKYIRQF